jgi:manganese/iron transport system permease protein
MMALSAFLGALAGVVGLYASWYTDLAAGGMIVLTATVIFFVALLLSPKHGLLRQVLARKLSAASLSDV